jgi:hypothetical protein
MKDTYHYAFSCVNTSYSVLKFAFKKVLHIFTSLFSVLFFSLLLTEVFSFIPAIAFKIKANYFIN